MQDELGSLKGFEEKMGINDLAREFAVPAAASIKVPINLLNTVREIYDKQKYPSLIRMDLQMLSDDDTALEDSEWLTKAPYDFLISPERLFLYSKIIADPQHPHAKLQILRLDFDSHSGSVHTLIRDADIGTFKIALSEFPERTILGKARQALNIQFPTEEDRHLYEKLLAESVDVVHTRDEILALSRKDIFSGTIVENSENASQIHVVGMGEYAYDSSERIRYLATHGAADCFIVSFYDYQERKGALTHIDGLTDSVATVGMMRKDLLQGTQRGSRLRITISGGTLGTVAEVVKVYQELTSWQQKDPNIEVLIGSVFQNSSESLALNLDTGDLLKFVPQPRSGDSLDALMIGIRSYQGKQPARLHNPM